MKRTLVILRHAKSSWSSDAPNDHSRPLNKRGARDAPVMGAYLAERGWLPEKVISSDSERTRLTVAGLFSRVELEPDVRFERDLYHAGYSQIRGQLRDTTENEVLVVGHNPGWEDAVERLAGTYHRFTTCNAAVFEVEGRSWDHAFEAGDWELIALARPKTIGQK